MAGDDVAAIKDLLRSRIESLVRLLAPGGRVEGRYWMARNPTRDDKRAGSFWVLVKGSGVGAWRDEATGDKGGIVELIQYVNGWPNDKDGFKKAMAWARDWLGLARADPDTIRRTAAHVVKRTQLDQTKAEAERLAKDRNRAFALWLKAKPDLSGTLAETYLATRGITLSALARPPRALRFLPASWHAETRQNCPALIAMMSGPGGGCFAVHRTFLKPDGSGKADVVPARKIWPSFKGAAIRLSRGESGLTPEEATRNGLVETLILCEGVEDGLSLALARPDLRVWAAGSLGNLGAIELPASIERVIIAADNDWGKPQAEAQLARAVQAMQAAGKDVSIARSHIGKDANDALRAA